MRAHDQGSPERGGWGWLFLPVPLMFFGSNLWFGAFYLASGSVQAAAESTVRMGPVVWSVNQIGLFVIAAHRLRRRDGRAVERLIGLSRLRGRDWIIGLAGGAVASALILGIQSLQRTGGSSAGWPTWVVVYWTLATSVTAGFGEELYFRGFLFRRLGRLNPWLLVAATSAAFAAWHVSPAMLLHTFVVGCLFGGVYLRTGSLWAAIIAHVATDAMGGVGMLLGWW